MTFNDKKGILTINLEENLQNTDTRIRGIEKKISKLKSELKALIKAKDYNEKEVIAQKAKHIFKQIKAYEHIIEKLNDQSFSIGQVNYELETLKNTAISVKSTKDSVKTMKKNFKKININEIQNLQDEMESLLLKAEVIHIKLGRKYGVPNIDEEQLAKELDDLADEIFTEKYSNVYDNLSEMTIIPNAQK